VDDLGSEINVQYVTKVIDNVTLAVKYGSYSAGDTKVDANKLWMWASTRF
jgi:hypothetical protein